MQPFILRKKFSTIILWEGTKQECEEYLQTIVKSPEDVIKYTIETRDKFFRRIV